SPFCRARDTASQPDLLDLFHLLEGAEKTQRVRIERRVDSDDGHRFSAGGFARQVVFGDVDLAVAEERSYFADDAGHVLVDHVNQISLGLELDAEVIDGNDALIFLAEKSSRNAGLFALRRRSESDQVVVVERSGMRGGADGDAARLRNLLCIDEVDRLGETRRQQALER